LGELEWEAPKLIINNPSICIINDHPLALLSVTSRTTGDDSTTAAAATSWPDVRGFDHGGPAGHRVPAQRGLPEGHLSPGLSVREIRGLHGHSLCPAARGRSEIQCE